MRLISVTICLKVFLFLVAFFPPDYSLAEIPAIAPGRTIIIVADNPGTPTWKNLWDDARKNVRENNFPKAIKYYDELLQIKPNIEVANWEYCKVLVKSKDYSSASKIIVSLLEQDPLRVDYLLMAGLVFLHQQDYALAAKYYGRVYELDPAGVNSSTVLSGLIDSLKGEGKYEIVFPLLEQLHVRNPHNVSLLHELARNASALGKTGKAKAYYSELLNRTPIADIGDRVLFQASEIFEDSKNKETAVMLWQEYIRRNPNYLPFQQKLADFYLKNDDGITALPHLLYMADKLSENDELLLHIAEIYLHESGRPDKSLKYYEKYQEKNPESKDVRKNIANIQSILANDFLSIVENDGAWLLWRDLAKVTPNRVPIYLEMADLLKKKKKYDELLEILLIIHTHEPENDKVTYKIVAHYRMIKDYILALKYLDKVTAAHKRTKSHYLLKGKIQEFSGLEEKALDSYSSALLVDSSDLTLRKSCISKAGGLGLIVELEKLFKDYPLKRYDKQHLVFIFNYFDQLVYNSLFDRLELLYRKFAEKFKNDPEALFRMQLHKVQSLRKKGKRRKAEELARALLSSGLLKNEVLFTLANNAIEDRNMEAARVWHSALSQTLDTNFNTNKNELFLLKIGLLEVRLLMAAGDLPAAERKIEFLKNADWKSGQYSDDFSLIHNLERELCWFYLKTGAFTDCARLLEKLKESKKFEPMISVVGGILKKQSGNEKFQIPSQHFLFIGTQPFVSRLLEVVRLELDHLMYDSARQHLDEIIQTGIDSLLVRILRAKLFFSNGETASAVDSYKSIHAIFPEEKFFLHKVAVSEAKGGNYAKSLAVLLENNENLHRVETADAYYDLSFDYEEIVLYTRMLWRDKQQEKALKVYELLLSPSVAEMLGQRFELEDISYHYLDREKSFWDSFLLLLQIRPEIVVELMSPSFLVDNYDKKTGKIVAEYYESFSWQKLLLNEYHARYAIMQRNYARAERTYKRLLEEEDNIEGLDDLASIYDRFGEYRKEAQVLEVMQKSGITSPEIESYIEESSMKIRPQTGLMGGFLSKSGRDGYINLENKSFGVALLFTPDLEKDIEFNIFRNYYGNRDNKKSLTGTVFESTGTIELRYDTDFLYVAGAERLSEGGGIDFHYSLSLSSKLDNYMSSYIEFYRKKVDDTLEAINDRIYSDGFEIGLSGETPVGVIIGGDYRLQFFTDGNSQNRFHGYSSYNIYREAVYMSLRYDYQYLDNSEGVEGQLNTVSDDEKLYWKPTEYNEHKVTFHFQQLIGGEYGSGGLLSYYSFDNSLGYEDSQNAIYTGEFDIFLEMNPHYLLKGNFVFIHGEEYEEKSVLFSLFYRW